MTSTYTFNNVNYSYPSSGTSTTATVTISPDASNNISILSTFAANRKTYTVRSIDNDAFNSRTNLISVIIPDTVTSIGDYAFKNCNSLTSVTIPNTVTKIGQYAFNGCSSLASVTIPNTLASIKNNVFDGCASLISVTIPNYVTNIGNSAFFGCSNLISVTLLTNSSSTTIGNNVFRECSKLPSITIPSNVQSIGAGTFYSCSSLTSVTLPTNANFTTISDNMFNSCFALTSITIPSSVQSIGFYTFSSCSKLSSVILPTNSNLFTIGDFAFKNTSVLTSIIIPTNVNSIINTAFTSSGLTTVFINSPNGLNITSPSTGTVTFYGKSGVTIMLPNQPAPVITGITTGASGTAVINFTQSLTSGAPAIINYEYSTNGGLNWLPNSQTTSPITVTSLTDESPYDFTIRNYNGYYSAASDIVTTSPSCYNEGTKILCLNKNLEEEYIPIENLRKGDLVKTLNHGYKKIDLIGKKKMINNPDKCTSSMYKMVKTDDNALIEDLIVLGGHGILVDEIGNYKEKNDKIWGPTVIIEDKYLLLASVSNDFIKLENTNIYTYYHFALESDENEDNDDARFGVWANGILSESTPKNDFIRHNYTLL